MCHAGEFLLHLRAVCEGVDKPGLYGPGLFAEEHEGVGACVQLPGGELPCLAYALYHVVPYGMEVDFGLLAVGGAHVGGGVGFYGGLECAYAEYLHVDSYFVECVFVEYGGGAESSEIEHPHGVEEDTVGNGCEVVLFLEVLVAVCEYELAAFLEVEQCLAYLVDGGVSGKEAVGFDIDAFYVVVVLGGLDGFEYVVEPEGHFAFLAVKEAEGVFFGTLVEFSFEVEV
nr:hypothetical protein PU94_14265 [Coprobacter secundus]